MTSQLIVLGVIAMAQRRSSLGLESVSFLFSEYFRHSLLDRFVGMF